MLGETITTLRKKQNLSQQELADRLHVVRQTISKWEKNLSVPDADALVRLADALDVTVPQLLGEPVAEDAQPADVAAALSRINEQLAVQNRRRSLIWKVVAWVLGLVLLFHILYIAVATLFAAQVYSTDVQTSYDYQIVDQLPDDTE